MFFLKIFDNIWSEHIADPSLVLAPPIDLFLRVRPEYITQQSGIRYVRWPGQFPDLFQLHQVWGQPSVHADDFVVDQGCYWQCVEAFCKYFP